MLICYPSCKKCKNLLISSIDSIRKYNPSAIFAIFNNNEYSKEDLKDIKKHCQKLLVFDISLWMDIFKDCEMLHSQRNCYIRLLMPRVFQKFDKRIPQIIYCDEDCYCIGSIEKFWKYPFESDVVGFKDISDVKTKHKNLWQRNGHTKEHFLVTLKKPYMNSGLLKFKTSFDIRTLIMPINRYNMLHTIGFKALHDQTLLNMIDYDIIPLYFTPTHDLTRYSNRFILSMFKTYNIAHTYGYKNNMEPLWRHRKK